MPAIVMKKKDERVSRRVESQKMMRDKSRYDLFDVEVIDSKARQL